MAAGQSASPGYTAQKSHTTHPPETKVQAGTSRHKQAHAGAFQGDSNHQWERRAIGKAGAVDRPGPKKWWWSVAKAHCLVKLSWPTREGGQETLTTAATALSIRNPGIARNPGAPAAGSLPLERARGRGRLRRLPNDESIQKLPYRGGGGGAGDQNPGPDAQRNLNSSILIEVES